LTAAGSQPKLAEFGKLLSEYLTETIVVLERSEDLLSVVGLTFAEHPNIIRKYNVRPSSFQFKSLFISFVSENLRNINEGLCSKLRGIAS
jgi:hypothetical protein